MADRLVVLISVEHLLTDFGLWCADCNLGSGAQVWFTVTQGGETVLRSSEVCADCGGKNVTS